MSITIREIKQDDEKKIIDLYNEYVSFNVNSEDDRFEGFRNLKDLGNKSFGDWLNNLKRNKNEKEIPKNYSTSTQYIAINEFGKIVGGICLRWKDVPSLLIFGGHIGYSIRPTERGKGYGSKMLKLALKEFKRKHKEKVLVSCKEFNIASKKIIEKNGGIYESSYYDEENKITYLRYWIPLK